MFHNANLQSVGIAPKYVRYQIVVGDPAYAILSDPIVSITMSIDMRISALYTSLAIVRITQFKDAWLCVTGCMYMSRCVCFAYLFMRIFSSVIKWRRWEASFAPVDPGLLAITAYIYSGLAISVLGRTRLVWLFYQLWDLFLPYELRDQAFEGISGD
ncbi:unnamed protein product [Aphanomyces euteiches]